MSDDAFSWLTSDQIYTHKRKSGVSSLEILALPDDLRQLVNQIMRREPVRMQELIDALERPANDVRGQVALLTAQGWLQTEEIEGETYYRVRLARRRARSLPPGLWQVLEGTWKIQLFRYLNSDEKSDFTRAFKLEQFEADEHIFEKGNWNQKMYLVDSGRIELVTQDADGQEVVLQRLKPGDIIGEIAVLRGERHWATARAVENASAWTLHKDDLDRLLGRSPSAGLSIQREIERQVRGLSQRDKGELERFRQLLVVGRGAFELAHALSGYTGERLLTLDLYDSFQGEDETAGQTENVQRRPARDLDSKGLAAAIKQGLKDFDRVIIAAPAELHSPLMGIISLIELVIDLSATKAPWVIAAARRRWTIPTARRADISYVARRLCQRVVGLALSGGGARALAHIGALRALEEAQVPIDMIASTGMGAVVAGLYAAGLSVDDLTDLAVRRERDLNPFDGSLNLRLISRSALYAGKRARKTLQEILQDRTFADLRLPLYVVAADLESGQPILFDQGPLIDAMEASVALAGLVVPAEISNSPNTPLNERWLVDGGLVNPMPTDVLSENGAGLIIGISAIPNPAARSGQPSEDRPDLTSTWLRLRDQLAYTALMNNLRHLDTLIMPAVEQFDDNDFESAAKLIAAGLTATQQEIEHIQLLLAPSSQKPINPTP